MYYSFADICNRVITFRLTSGEEMIAKVNDYHRDIHMLSITDPVFIAHTPKGLQFAPGIFTIDPTAPVMINTSSIAIFGETEENIKFKYIEATTGIQLPDKKIIMG